ncbi:Csu type fimbrial protein [Paracoccus sp. T5]|uniref:Csu type fimbrial protein n=1 Tax=Paracoccus sp. T5 TaxID=3402161 RepID=UPI003ADB415C
MFLTRLSLVLVLLVAAAQTSEAQTCSFSATDIVLGSVDVLGTSPTTATGTISVDCTSFLNLLSSIEVRIHLGEGLGGRSGSLRRMTSVTTATGLSYNLFKDAAGTSVFGGDYGTFGGDPMVLSGGSFLSLATSQRASVPVYARVPAGQASVLPGSYQSAFTRDPIDVRVDYRTCQALLLCANRTATFSFAVRAQVQPDCRVQADTLDFGTHGMLSGPVDATSQIRATCTQGTPYSIGIGYGLSGTSAGTRAMRNLGGGRIGYNLFRDAARSQTWGLASEGLAALSSGSGSSQSAFVYGRVPAQNTPAPGLYSDTVNVVLTY